jgi:hypothetical protein
MTSELKLSLYGGALKMRRDGKDMGIFSGAEIEMLIARQDGGILLTDEVFDPTQQKWMRLSEAILQVRNLKPPVKEWGPVKTIFAVVFLVVIAWRIWVTCTK